jgi:hypothetical protein
MMPILLSFIVPFRLLFLSDKRQDRLTICCADAQQLKRLPVELIRGYERPKALQQTRFKAA